MAQEILPSDLLIKQDYTFPVYSEIPSAEDLLSMTDARDTFYPVIRDWNDLLQLPVTTDDDCDVLTGYLTEQKTSSSIAYDRDFLKVQNVYEAAENKVVQSTAFVEAVETVNWCNKPPSVFRLVIDMALQLEAVTVAYKLAALGHDLYPSNTFLARAASVLAPPVIVEHKRPPKKGLSASMEWLAQHAETYRGSWVAVNNGALIAIAATSQALMEQLKAISADSNTLIMRVP
jgi:hypothetical protein